MNESFKKTAYDMIYISSCAINGIKPNQSRVNSMDLDSLYKICKYHSLISLVCMGLELSNIDIPKNWIEDKARTIRKVMLLDIERENILKFCEDNHIWYMPLKGVILKDLYPKMGMRQMADNDILYDKMYQQKLSRYFVNNGYIIETIGKGSHDVYLKNPIYNYEMHTSLYDADYNSTWVDYYSNVKDRLIKDNNNSYGYHFTDDDFYIYITTHEYKHYSLGGTGLRSLIDCYVYNQAKKDTLNWSYIETEFKKLGIYDFEQNTKNLSYKIFSNPNFDIKTLSQKERKMLDYVLFSGTYGTKDNVINNKLRKIQPNNEISVNTKLKYYWYRLFPPIKSMETYYPFFGRHKILLPFGYIYRLVVKGFIKRKEVSLEFKTVFKK